MLSKIKKFLVFSAIFLMPFLYSFAVDTHVIDKVTDKLGNKIYKIDVAQ
jgi:hypothetical protein